MSNSIHCPNCGTESDSKYCPNCGTNLDNIREKVAEITATNNGNNNKTQPAEKHQQTAEDTLRINADGTINFQRDTDATEEHTTIEEHKQPVSANIAKDTSSTETAEQKPIDQESEDIVPPIENVSQTDSKATFEQPTINEQDEEQYQHTEGNRQFTEEESSGSNSGKKSLINFVLIILMFVSIIGSYTVLGFRTFITPDSINSFGLGEGGFCDVVVEYDDGKTISASQHILNLMGDYFKKDLEITEKKMNAFFFDSDVKESVANLYYLYIKQFVDLDNTECLTAKQFADIFRNNPESVKDSLKVEFGEYEYALLEEAFLCGFLGNLSTTDVIIQNHNLQLTNALFSENTIWFCLSLLGLSCCLYILVNGFNILALLKLLFKNVIVASVILTAIVLFYKFFMHSIFAGSMLMACIIPIAITSLFIGVTRIRHLARSVKSTLGIGEDEQYEYDDE